MLVTKGGADSLAACVDDLVPQAGRLRADSTFNAVEAKLVDHCDILLGMFWTKLGTSTGVAESGTVEEIDQFVAAKKPALLYFSERPISTTFRSPSVRPAAYRKS